MTRRILALVAVVVTVLGLSACTHKATSGNRPSPSGTATASGSNAPIQVGGTRALLGNERSYGTSVGPIPGAVYQPDVVLIGGGADAIVGAQDNGLVWTVKGNAPGVDELAVGKIMAATSFATGRVLKLQSVEGGNKQVILGPVGLTDVFKQLHVASSSPVTLSSPLAYAYNHSPLTSNEGDDGQDAMPPPAPDVAYSRQINAAGPVAIPSTIPSQPPSFKLEEPAVHALPVHEGKFTLTSICCSPDQAVRISYNEPAGRMAAIVGMIVGPDPLVDFHIDIDFSGLKEAVFELHGPQALEFQFDAATKDASGNYRSPTMRIPLSFSFPVGNIPFTVTLDQSIHASIQLAGQAAFKSEGKYKIDGALGFAYRNGKFQWSKPHFSSELSSLQNAFSLSAGINALSIGYGVHFAIGIGVIGFNGGPFFDVDATLAIDKDGSPPQTSLTAGCATAAVSVKGTIGVGYTIPNFLARALNKFLSIFDAGPIPASGGPRWGPFPIWDPGSGKLCYNRTGS